MQADPHRSDDKLFAIATACLYQEHFPELAPLLQSRAQAHGRTPAQELAKWPPVTIDATECGNLARCKTHVHNTEHGSMTCSDSSLLS